MSGFVLLFLVTGQVVITEVMANPKGGSGAHSPDDRNEFVEIYNAGRGAVDLFNYTLSDGDATDQLCAWLDSTILILNPDLVINSTWLKPGGYAVILDPEYTDSVAVGGYVQPYRFGDSSLILTVSNTTLGNGLSGNDPITLASPYGDTTTFGTPQSPGDGFPVDAGDGFSWERVDILGPDLPENWEICPDSSGSTPGRANAVSFYYDLAVIGMAVVDTAPLEPGMRFEFAVRVKNLGFVAGPEWRLNCVWERGDDVAEIEVASLAAKQETTFIFETTAPRSRTALWSKVVCPGDKETLNNFSRMFVTPRAQSGVLNLGLESFSPDGDGFEDSLPVSFCLPEPGGRLTLKVFDLAGRTVRVIFTSHLVEEVQGFVYWDGKTTRGEVAPTGLYAVYLEYRYSGRKVSAKQPVVLVKR
ncbi:MAG: lamin tail domain-containing protein [bacterium]